VVARESAAGADGGRSCRAARKREISFRAATVATSFGANEDEEELSTAPPCSARRRSSLQALALAFQARLYAELYERSQTALSSTVIPVSAGGLPAHMMAEAVFDRERASDITASSAATDVAFVAGEETAAMEAVTTENLHNCRNYGEDG